MTTTTAPLDAINVTLIYGYDTGIWSNWKNYTHQFTAADFVDSKL